MKPRITFLNRFETAAFILFIVLFSSLHAFSQALVDDEINDRLALKFTDAKFFSTFHDPFLKEDMIPVNPQAPEGIYYMVQVGAYQNPITPDLYPHYGPLVAHQLANGMTRYLVGYFRSYQDAMDARNQMVKTPGYEKSFVVAYQNNKFVSLGFAWRMQQKEGFVPGDVAKHEATKQTPYKCGCSRRDARVSRA
jgi:hypothetical protein